MMLTGTPATLRFSPAGQLMLKDFEGVRLKAYRDIAGIWTIGIGDTADVRPGMEISMNEAIERFRNRLAREFEPAVRRSAAHPDTTQNQYDAMVSLCYNIGVGTPRDDPRGPSGFAGSSVARYHSRGNFTLAADCFLLWRKVNGIDNAPLLKRRHAERKLYLRP